VDLAIYISILILFYFIFKIFIKIQKLEKDISKLVQKIAIENAEKPKENEHAGEQRKIE
jgi:hypothetical protein